MSLRIFYTVVLYIKFPLTLKRCFNLNCSEEVIKLFCSCIFNVIKGNVKVENKVNAKLSTLSREKSIIATLCSKKNISLKRKRQPLASRGLRLLKFILPSVLNLTMTSNGSLKEFILITNDEYCFLKNQPLHESKRLEYSEKQKQQFLAQVPASTSLNSASEGTTNSPIDKEQALIAQINLKFEDFRIRRNQVEKHRRHKSTLTINRTIHRTKF